MGSWMIIRGIAVTGTVLTTTEFCDFYVLVITLTLLTFRRNTTVSCPDAAREVADGSKQCTYDGYEK